MNQSQAHISNRVLRAPRTAATAGIVFGFLMGLSLILIQISVPAGGTNPRDWLQDQAKTVSFAVSLLPFAGIAFLWFMGVIRDRLGHLEDQFFSTLFFGSGLLYLAMTFASTAIAGGVLALYSYDPELLNSSGLYIYSQALIYKFNNVYALRMAGMHMIVLGTIWTRTQVMPRWVAFGTYLLAIVLLFAVGFIPELTLIFPAWVFLISLYILYLNFRFRQDQTAQDGLTPEPPL